MKSIKYLQTRGAFAIACEVHIEHIQVGLLCLNGQQLLEADLLDPSSGDRYTVELPPLKGAEYNVKLLLKNASIQD
jgi:hypothetical protein